MAETPQGPFGQNLREARGADVLYDAHVHMDFMSNAREVALDADKLGMRLFANTVTPSGFIRARKLLGDLQNVQVGLGLHPWWVREADVGDFVRLSGETSWIGEVGLDFSPKRAHHEDQLAAFIRIARTCAEQGDKTLSIHSVRAASTVLDVLEETGCCASCRCIFHWFSGSTEDLWRAIRLGCWFSVNEMQASTRRAKEQLKLIPQDKLLFETDLPPQQGEPFSAEQIKASLERAHALVASIRGA
jgi:TatD DNase family protein